MEQKRKFEKNHIYPKFHLKKWKNLSGKILEKESGIIREIDLSNDLTKHKYYWIENDSELEERFGKFEGYIEKIISKIIISNNESIELTSKQLYLLKLYCKFAAERQEDTSFVVKYDEFEFYKNNDYDFGTFIMKDREEVLKQTKIIIDKFENVILNKKFKYKENIDFDNLNDLCDGVHLVILRNKMNNFCVGNICGFIENTGDNDHLYFYLPVAPNIALMLVNSEFYLNQSNYEFAKKYLPRKFHVKFNLPFVLLPKNKEEKTALTKMNFFNVIDDEYLSYVFDDEKILFDSYYNQDIIKQNNKYKIKINDVSDLQVHMINSIIYEDSNIFIYVNEKALDYAQELKAEFRTITMGIR